MERIISPTTILRDNNKQHRYVQKQRDRRIKHKKFLKQEIYQNNNIFQSKNNLYRNMTAQNIIWQKNYNFKKNINILKEQNSSLKARLWNIEKENRRMDKQIEGWNLTKFINNHHTKKPYIDMATVEKVCSDQDYNIVSIKIQIFDLQNQLLKRQAKVDEIVGVCKNMKKMVSHYNHEMIDKKIKLCHAIHKDNQSESIKLEHQKQGLILIRQNRQLQSLSINTELKKKSKSHLLTDLQAVSKQCELHKYITDSEIKRLNEQILTMKTQDCGNVLEQKQKHQLSVNRTIQFECMMQEEMGAFIKKKINIQNQISICKSQILDNNFEKGKGQPKGNQQ